MVMLRQEIKPTEQEDRGFEILPIGYYKAVAIEENEKDASTGGKYITFQFEVLSPHEFSKRRIFNNYNIVNASQQTVNIALEQLGNLAWAVGLTGGLSDTGLLLLKEVTLEVGIKPAGKDKKGIDRPASNIIRAYWPASWSETQIEGHKKAKKGHSSSASAPVASTPSPAVSGGAPWKKK